MIGDRNILIGEHVIKSDERLFEPLSEGEKLEYWPSNTTWPDLLTDIFPSKSQARKAGWREIPEGWTDVVIGKKRTRFCIIKMTKPIEG